MLIEDESETMLHKNSLEQKSRVKPEVYESPEKPSQVKASSRQMPNSS